MTATPSTATAIHQLTSTPSPVTRTPSPVSAMTSQPTCPLATARGSPAVLSAMEAVPVVVPVVALVLVSDVRLTA